MVEDESVHFHHHHHTEQDRPSTRGKCHWIWLNRSEKLHMEDINENEN
jgi:hypothetical protein